mmetsp:Transcript_19925/g.64874  ORF Transcript_19925/g.64874 Transcript_19925/m.64874 type:complete len:264 (-) Transcript_19925:62-853(-)
MSAAAIIDLHARLILFERNDALLLVFRRKGHERLRFREGDAAPELRGNALLLLQQQRNHRLLHVLLPDLAGKLVRDVLAENVRSSLQKQPRHRLVPSVRRPVQSRVPIRILILELSPSVDEELQHPWVALTCGDEKRNIEVPILRVDIGTCCQKDSRHSIVAMISCSVEQRLSRTLVRLKCRSPFRYESLSIVDIVVPDSQQQLSRQMLGAPRLHLEFLFLIEVLYAVCSVHLHPRRRRMERVRRHDSLFLCRLTPGLMVSHV